MQEEDLGKCSAVERARKMAVVLTEHIRPEYMTCREVVSAGRYPYTGRMGILQPRDKEIVEEAMARMKVTELSERDFNAISDGQKQRVLVARAIAQDTPVLLLDEPTSYLDLRYRTELMETLKDLAREGRTVLMSLHIGSQRQDPVRSGGKERLVRKPAGSSRAGPDQGPVRNAGRDVRKALQGDEAKSLRL